MATEALAEFSDLLALPCYRWTHSVVVPPGHALADDAAAGRPLTLHRLAEYPLITYESGYTGRSHIDDAFGTAGLQPQIVLEAMDADRKFYGIKRLLGLLAEDRSHDPEKILKHILDDVAGFIRSEPYHDDLTMLAMEVTG